MGLFNKKLSLEEILKAIQGLSEEEKAQVKAEMEKASEELRYEDAAEREFGFLQTIENSFEQ